MNWYLAAAGVLSLALGVVHSVLGEVMIFRRRGSEIAKRYRGIIRATWHVASVFGWGVGAILLRLAQSSSAATHQSFLESSIAVVMLASGLITLYGTRARHPGWVVFLGIAVLVWLG